MTALQLAALHTKMSDTNKSEDQNPTETEEIAKTSDELDTSKAPEMESTSANTTKTESDYESAGGSDDEEQGGDRLRKRDEDEEEASDAEEVNTGDEEELYEDKREEGDGQESVPAKEKKLDDDEDRRNPQYIPKKGTFYEHDDRGADDDVPADPNAEEDPAKKDDKTKKPWKESTDKWSHDKFNESDQAPKSRDELVTSYGYDIRSEEGPPRARRRRRYGRGPNKYDRNWEDENAYSKPTRGGGVVSRGRRPSESGRSSAGGDEPEEIQVHSEEQFPSLNPKRGGGPRGGGRRSGGPAPFESKQTAEQTTPPKPTNQPSRGGRGRGGPGGGSGGPSGRMVRGSGRMFEGRGRGGRRDEPEEAHLENNLKNLSLKEPNGEQHSRDFRRQPRPKGENYHQTPPTERRQANVPPRMQQEGSGNRSKRYSSQRQRSLPESSAAYDQNAANSGNFYDQGYQQHPGYPEGVTGQAGAAPGPNVVPVTSAGQILQAGAPFPTAAFIAPAQPATRIFPGAPPPAAPFMAPPNPQMINFVQPPATQFPAAFPPFQTFPAVPAASPPQPPAEMYVPSGITYYSTQNQVPRPTPLKRPKAAIPIVPPPDDQLEGSGAEDKFPTDGVSKEVVDCATDIVHKIEEAVPEVLATEISA